MGTKNNPGKYDCLSKAEPDEPFFVLMARDEYSDVLVEVWRCLAAGRFCDALSTLERAFVMPQEPLTYSSDKSREAIEVASQMRAWRRSRRPDRTAFKSLPGVSVILCLPYSREPIQTFGRRSS